MSQIELSKEGFKLSYQRYLSDGVTGLIFISFFVIAFIKKWELPFVGDKWLELFSKKVSTESQIAFLVFLFLIAPSVGLTLSAFSWFLLGTPLVRLIWLWHKFSKLKYLGFPLRFIIEATNRSYDEKKLLKFFKVDNSIPSFKKRKKTTSESLYEISNYYEHLLIFNFPAYFASQMEYIQGSRRLFRSITMMMFSLVIYFWFVHYNPSLIFTSLLSAVFFLFFTSLIEYYQAMKMLFMIYSLIMDNADKAAALDRREIARLLVEKRIPQTNTG